MKNVKDRLPDMKTEENWSVQKGKMEINHKVIDICAIWDIGKPKIYELRIKMENSIPQSQ